MSFQLRPCLFSASTNVLCSSRDQRPFTAGLGAFLPRDFEAADTEVEVSLNGRAPSELVLWAARLAAVGELGLTFSPNRGLMFLPDKGRVTESCGEVTRPARDMSMICARISGVGEGGCC